MTPAHRRILVIEDDAETAEQIADFLATRGYQVDVAADSNDGLRLGQSATYAVMGTSKNSSFWICASLPFDGMILGAGDGTAGRFRRG